jgi:hypothetical protein
MIPIKDVSLTEQRLVLRQRLQAQREEIARRLGPLSATDGGYPRSRTMRFLARRPALAGQLLAGLASLLVGRRIFRS